MKSYIRFIVTLSCICQAASIHNLTENSITVHTARDCISINAEDSFELSRQESTYIPEALLPQMCILVKFEINNHISMKMLSTTNQDDSSIYLRIENNQPLIEMAQG